jgi:hypothetical protein
LSIIDPSYFPASLSHGQLPFPSCSSFLATFSPCSFILLLQVPLVAQASSRERLLKGICGATMLVPSSDADQDSLPSILAMDQLERGLVLLLLVTRFSALQSSTSNSTKTQISWFMLDLTEPRPIQGGEQVGSRWNDMSALVSLYSRSTLCCPRIAY